MNTQLNTLNNQTPVSVSALMASSLTIGEKVRTVKRANDGKDRDFLKFNPMTDIVFGKVEDKKFLDKEKGTEGTYWIIYMQRKYPNGTVGLCEFKGPQEKANQGISKYDPTKAKKKDGQVSPQNQASMMNNMFAQQQMMMAQGGMNGMNPMMNPAMMQQMMQGGMNPMMNGGMQGNSTEQKKSFDKYSIKAEYNPYSREDHKAFLDMWDNIYRAILWKLNEPSVKGACGMKGLNIKDEADLMQYSVRNQHASVSYPIYYPTDKSTSSIVEGATPSNFWPVWMEGREATLFTRPNVSTDLDPIPVEAELLQKCSFDFEAIYRMSKIVINGKGPTAGISTIISEAVVSNPSPLTRQTHMGDTINNLLTTGGNVYDIWNTNIADIKASIDAEKAEKAATQGIKSGEKIDDSGNKPTSSGLAPIGRSSQLGMNPTATYNHVEHSQQEHSQQHLFPPQQMSNSGSGPFAALDHQGTYQQPPVTMSNFLGGNQQGTYLPPPAQIQGFN